MTATKAMSSKDMQGNKLTNLGAPTAGSNDSARKVDVETAYTAAISRANHTGTQLAATISDFDTQVRTSRLDQMAAPTTSVNLNSQKITNLLDPTVAQDAATKNYVDTQISGLVSGQVLKGAVRAAVTTNVNIASPGATLDGLTAANGEIYLLVGQTTGTQNGPYVYNGAATPMTRATNWDVSAEAVLGSYWVVEAGSKADQLALMTNDTAITIGTSTPAFTFISVAGAAIGRFSATSPVVTAGGTWTVNHNLNSRDVEVTVYRSASPWDEVDVYVARLDANNVTVIPDVAMASGEYTCSVKY